MLKKYPRTDLTNRNFHLFKRFFFFFWLLCLTDFQYSFVALLPLQKLQGVIMFVENDDTLFLQRHSTSLVMSNSHCPRVGIFNQHLHVTTFKESNMSVSSVHKSYGLIKHICQCSTEGLSCHFASLHVKLVPIPK